MERQSCARRMRAENPTIATYVGWTSGVVAALGIGAAILSGAGVATADASSGSASSPSAHSTKSPTGHAHSARKSSRPAASANTSRNAAVSPTVTQPRKTVAQTLARMPSAAAPSTAPAPVMSKVTLPNPVAMVTAALNSFFRHVQTTLSAAGIKITPRTGPSTWGAPTRTVNFTDASVLSQFVVYTGTYPEGIRTPEMISFSNGTMTITGDAQGHDEGIAWVPGGQKYGGWEVRMRVAPGAANYDPVLLLWPDAENWPKGGEVDFMEMWDDPTRQTVNSVLHYGPNNKQIKASVAVDATQWHTYAVKWTSTQITTYVDGVPLLTSTNRSQFPPGSMHLCIQLDTMGPDIAAGASMEVAWAKQYSLAAIT